MVECLSSFSSSLVLNCHQELVKHKQMKKASPPGMKIKVSARCDFQSHLVSFSPFLFCRLLFPSVAKSKVEEKTISHLHLQSLNKVVTWSLGRQDCSWWSVFTFKLHWQTEAAEDMTTSTVCRAFAGPVSPASGACQELHG